MKLRKNEKNHLHYIPISILLIQNIILQNLSWSYQHWLLVEFAITIFIFAALSFKIYTLLKYVIIYISWFITIIISFF